MTAPLMLHVEPRHPKRPKWPWRLLWAFLLIIGGTCGYWWWSYSTSLAERDKLVAELRAQGQPITWRDLAEKLLAEPTAGTGAKLYMQALWELGGDLNRAGPRLPSATLEANLEKDRKAPAIRTDVQKEIALGAPAIAALEQAVKLPAGLLTTGLRTDDPIAILLPHIQDSRSLVRLLHWMAYDALARKDAKAAYHAVELSLGASQQLAKEPFLISQLVRLAMRGNACETLTMCLCHAAPPDEEFRAIDKAFASVDDTFGAGSAWLSERAMWMTVLDDPKKMKLYFQDYGFFGRPRPSSNEFQAFLRNRWIDVLVSPVGTPVMLQTQSAFLRLHENIAGKTDTPKSDRVAHKAAYEEFERNAPLTRMGLSLGQWGFPALNTFDEACAKAHRRNIIARLALRLRRHYDKHGRFPESLDALCNADMPKIRLDWFEGKPIVYQPNGKRFRLEVPNELLSKADLDRKKQGPEKTPEFVIEVEIRD